MKLKTKRIRYIEMTHEEHAKFLELMRKAEEGHVTHYAESKLDDGSYLGVNLVEKHEEEPLPPPRRVHSNDYANGKY